MPGLAYQDTNSVALSVVDAGRALLKRLEPAAETGREIAPGIVLETAPKACCCCFPLQLQRGDEVVFDSSKIVSKVVEAPEVDLTRTPNRPVLLVLHPL